ncbi:MAG: HAMP domain-containing histidine kinase [Ruminococcaceae bacterium]|nr:HAMP domain-containing histidine kinase [Oscillospiraceae bacterium]
MRGRLQKKSDTQQKKRVGAEKSMIRFRHTLRWRLTLFVFAVTITSGLLTVLLAIALVLLAPSTPWIASVIFNPTSFCLLLLVVCSIFGTLLSGVFGKYYLRPLKRLIDATNEVKKGNFKIQVEQIDRARTEMGQLIESFNEMVRELDSTELFRNDFINNFSHEFKTPIVSIRGFAKEMEIGGLDPDRQREYAHIIAEEADRLSKLSINILELSKLENQQIVTDKELFYLDEQLRQSILLHEPTWNAKNIEIIPELEEIKYYGNQELLFHVWNNLIGNAIKFTPECGTVTVRLTDAPDFVTVAVIDTGIGMSDEIKERIFEKFYQGDLSHHRVGNGIGLTMAHRAVTLAGGEITVESSPNLGSTFTVVLPK